MSVRPSELKDRFDITKERVFISGTQALVRMCLMRRELDARNDLSTAGYVSGYRGSPLGGLDQQFPKAQEFLNAANVIFEPALNEDLAATALWGTQQAEMRGEGAYDGVFGLWYGKGPGVDRSGDVLRHSNLAGTSPQGGVLVLMGDDHTCESSTTAHQSEFALMDAMIPILNPCNVQEIIDYGLHGWTMSRFAGVWCGLKAVKDNIESTASVNVGLERFSTVMPVSYDMPEGGLNIRVNDPPQDQEARLHQHKLLAVKAYARANTLDKLVWAGGPSPTLGVVSTGKSYMDTLQALEELGIDELVADEIGLSLYKVAMSWPLEPEGMQEFAAELDQIIVVEEKRGLIEDQLKILLYGQAGAPSVIGKQDEAGKVLFQSEAALNPIQIAIAIGKRLNRQAGQVGVSRRTDQLIELINTERAALDVQRKPYFCAGCPHNSSTVIPEGARGYAGIGCHWMVQFMDRETEGYTHMGGEGANWIGESRFSTRRHVFQNIGDGTFNHSGVMAIRAAVASKANITYKLLFNDAVAMTGGQAHEGGLTSYDIAAEVQAMGIKRLAYVSDQPDQVDRSALPAGTRVSHRDDLQRVQKSLSGLDGVTVLLYEQTCAAEKRRRRKRGIMDDPPKRVFINEAVCEGCGDCGVQSNCVAILPLETSSGRKREIDQSACNKDFSCVNGFCPSFVTVEGGQLRKPDMQGGTIPGVPEPEARPSLERPYAITLTGVGGTGVVTIGALLGMAAHVEGKGCGIIDMAGLAQKGGAVVSHIKIANDSDEIKAIRIARGGADLLLGCDLLVSTSEPVLSCLDKESSQIVVNTNETLPGDFTRDANFQLPVNLLHQRLKSSVTDGHIELVNATAIATALLGNSIAANLFMLGVAYQRGLIPVDATSIARAIEINSVEVAFNQQAFQWGRAWVLDASVVEDRVSDSLLSTDIPELTLDELIEDRAGLLIDYQDVAYADRFRQLVGQIRKVDSDKSRSLTRAVTRSTYKLMAYKDEYEVARLYTDEKFEKKIKQQFEGDFKLKVHLAPPFLSRLNPDSGKVRKRIFGPWVFSLFRRLASMKKLRGTALDVFGMTAERREERRLVMDYEMLIEELSGQLNSSNYRTAMELAELPEQIRGFGHVKMKSIDAYKKKQSDLLDQFRHPDQQSQVA